MNSATRTATRAANRMCGRWVDSQAIHRGGTPAGAVRPDIEVVTGSTRAVSDASQHGLQARRALMWHQDTAPGRNRGRIVHPAPRVDELEAAVRVPPAGPVQVPEQDVPRVD